MQQADRWMITRIVLTYPYHIAVVPLNYQIANGQHDMESNGEEFEGSGSYIIISSSDEDIH